MRGPHTAMKSGPHLLQLEKALAQKRRLNTAKNKLKKKKKKVAKSIDHKVRKLGLKTVSENLGKGTSDSLMLIYEMAN